MTSLNEIAIDNVHFFNLKLNNDGHISIEFSFNNEDG